MLSQTISHYRILSHLGTSLIGEVYLAEDLQLGRKVAFTVLPEQFTRDSERMQLLAQEARTLSALNHPNIRMIYEVGQEEAQYFVVTEFVEGPTLRKHLAETRMTLEQVLEVAVQCATGLTAAHAAGVLHRDLKPENIMLRPDGYVKILDFGLAKLVEQDSLLVDLNVAPASHTEPLAEPGAEEPAANPDGTTAEFEETALSENDPYRTKPLDLTDAAQLLAAQGQRATGGLWWVPGTSGYLSPEQILGLPVDERSDIFSLGVVLYEMCTGYLPYAADSTTTMLSAILQTPPPSINRFMPEAPEELEWIVTKALAKEPDERYQTVREWLSDLKRLKQRLEFSAEQARLDPRDSQTGRKSGRQRVPDTAPMLPRDSGAELRSVVNNSTGRGTNVLASRSGSTRGASEPIDSLAILPLANASDDPSAEYLSDGITESIINTLSRLSGVRVMARSTVFRYKGRDADPLAVGRELGVRAVMAGRLLQRGERIVIKVELVDANDGALLWAEQYQRQMGDIFALEADIAQQISDHLRVKLSGELRLNLAKRYTENPEAYDLYLKGRFFWNQRDPDAMKKAVEYFVQSIRKDPTFALAYCGMADCYTLLSWGTLPPREFVPKARLSITRALELDEQLPEAHASLGFLTMWYDWDFLKAERELLRAIELNPNLATAHHWYSYALMLLERTEDALAQMRHALTLDPLSLVITTDIGELLYRQRRYQEAIAQCQKARDLDPQFGMAIFWQLLCYLQTERYDDAISILEPMLAESPRPSVPMLLTIAHAKAGNLEQAQQHWQMLQQMTERQYVPPYYLAVALANLGEKDQAFAWLEKGYQERSGWLPWLKQDPLADTLRTDPRFSDLLRRIGLQP